MSIVRSRSCTLRPTPRPLVVFALALGLGSSLLPGCGGTSHKPVSETENILDQPGGREHAIGEDALKRGDKAKAIAEFEAAIKINPQLTKARMDLADIYREDKNYAQAEQQYVRVAQLEPQNFDATYLSGLMQHLQKKLGDAIRSYLGALRLRPDDFQTNLNLATAYYQLGENASARPFAEKAVRLDPKSGPARFNLGAIYSGLELHDQAIAEYQQATELMPYSGQLAINLADSYGKLGRYQEMRNTLETVNKTSPTAESHERLGYALFKMRQYEPALESFQRALALDKDYFPALNGLGVSELNKWVWSDKTDVPARDRAVSALRRSLSINRDQPRIEELLGRYGGR